jgi:predicted metalloprotease
MPHHRIGNLRKASFEAEYAAEFDASRRAGTCLAPNERTMRWDQDHESSDLIDERGRGGNRMAGGSMLGLLPLLLRFRYGWVLIVLVLGYSAWRGVMGGGSRSVAEAPVAARGSDEPRHFVAFVLDDTQATWQRLFAEDGRQYRHAKLVLFSDSTNTGCGFGDAATGPFYCPNDERVYIDLAFYNELAQRFGAKGDFAEAYVIAHEIGHHVQKQLGISTKVERAGKAAQLGPTGLSVRLELQADCFAGIWARSTKQRQILDPGDVDEALGAASAVGDDHIQRQTSGTVRPESWTHGSSAERSAWFKRGLDSGTLADCDTFKSSSL